MSVIKSISLSWFRGAAENAVLHTRGKSVAIYGSNGSGKSTFSDALEYVVSGGRIGHLSHQYSGTRQEKGVRNTHCPSNTCSTIEVEFVDGGLIHIEVETNGNHTTTCQPTELSSLVNNWDTNRVIMRQDEVAAFIHCTRSDKYSVLLPLLGLANLEQAAENMHALADRVRRRTSLDDLEQRRKVLEAQAGDVLGSVTDDVVHARVQDLLNRYLPDGVAPGADADQVMSSIRTAINGRINALEPQNRLHTLLSQIADQALETKAKALTSAENALSRTVDAMLDGRIAVLEPTKVLIDQIADPDQEILCPACGRKIRASELAEHVRGELQKLSEVRYARQTLRDARRQCADSLNQIKTLVASKEIQSWLGSPSQTDCQEAVTALVGIDTKDIGKWTGSESRTLQAQAEILNTRVKVAASVAPPSVAQLIEDQKAVEAISKLEEAKGLSAKTKAIRNMVVALELAESSTRQVIRSQTENIILNISQDVRRLWVKLHPDEPIDTIQLFCPEGSDKAIDIGLRFYGVEQDSPRLTLSEGHRNSLGLCIFLAVLLSDPSYDGPVLLDDVVSSLDREHRGRLADLLLDDLAGRQVVLLTHDREWFAELRMRLPAAKWEFANLRPWENPKRGLQWSESKNTLDDARSLIQANAEAAGNRARATMDTQLALVAESLRISMPFLRGDKNDRRMSYDFLRYLLGEAKDRLRKRADGSWKRYDAPLADWGKAQQLLVAWANRASHSGTLTTTEAKDLIEVCEVALSRFRCESCGDPVWIADQAKKERLQCSCGELQWRYG